MSQPAKIFGWLIYPLIGAIAWAISSLVPLVNLDGPLRDTGFRIERRLAMPAPLRHQVVLVAIDQKTLDKSNEPMDLMLQTQARLLDAITAGQPRAVLLDFTLPERSYAIRPEEDARQIAAALSNLHQHIPFVTGLTSDAQRKLSKQQLNGPLLQLIAWPDSLGYMQVPHEPDGVVRKIDGLQTTVHTPLPTLVSQLLKQIHVPMAPGWINYAIGTPFDPLPAWKIIHWYQRRNIDSLRRAFAGKIVAVGFTLPFEDRKPQPVDLLPGFKGGPPGVLVHAQALRSYLNGRIVNGLPVTAGILAIVAAVLIGGLPLRYGNVLLVPLVFGVCGTSLICLQHDYWLSPLPSTVAALLTTLLINARALRHNIQERQLIRKIFSGYVSEDVLHSILSGALENDLSRHRRPLAFLFADIRGFTRYSEETPPEIVLHRLNQYFTVMTACVHHHGGTVDKFRGDGLMAFFGAPRELTDSAGAAVRTALAMLESLPALNEQLMKDNGPPFRIGIGIAYGSGIVGNVGSPERHDYTALGAAANLAAHIQEYTKETEFDLLVDSSAGEAVVIALPAQGFTEIFPANLPKHKNIKLYGYKHKTAAI